MKKDKAQILRNNQDIGFIKYGVNVFLKHKDVETAQISNDYGTIVLSRQVKEKTTSHVIGFALPYSSDDDTNDKLRVKKRSSL
jgi:hypothetical protein